MALESSYNHYSKHSVLTFIKSSMFPIPLILFFYTKEEGNKKKSGRKLVLKKMVFYFHIYYIALVNRQLYFKHTLLKPTNSQNYTNFTPSLQIFSFSFLLHHHLSLTGTVCWNEFLRRNTGNDHPHWSTCTSRFAFHPPHSWYYTSCAITTLPPESPRSAHQQG